MSSDSNPAFAALPALDETLTFMRTLWYLEHALERASKAMEDLHGVTGPQRLALRVIGVLPGIGAAELAAALHLHPSTITGILQRLETRRLIARVRDPHDGRRVHLRTTKAGARLNTPGATGTVEEAVRRVLRDISPRHRSATVAVLDRLAASLVATAEHAAQPVRARRRPSRR